MDVFSLRPRFNPVNQAAYEGAALVTTADAPQPNRNPTTC